MGQEEEMSVGQRTRESLRTLKRERGAFWNFFYRKKVRVPAELRVDGPAPGRCHPPMGRVGTADAAGRRALWVAGELRGTAATRAGERGSRPAALPGAEPRGPGPRRPAEPRRPGRERGRGGPRRCGVSGAGAGAGAAAMFSFFVNRSHLHTTISIHKKNNAIRPAGRARWPRRPPPLGARGAGRGARRRGPAGRLRPGPLGSRASPCGAALVDTVMWEISAGEVLWARDRSIHKVPGRPFRRDACTLRAAGRPAGRARGRRGGLHGAGRPPAAGTGRPPPDRGCAAVRARLVHTKRRWFRKCLSRHRRTSRHGRVYSENVSVFPPAENAGSKIK